VLVWTSGNRGREPEKEWGSLCSRVECNVDPPTRIFQSTRPDRNRNSVTMDVAQYPMARAALQIDVRSLAAMADVSPTTITRLEGGETLYPRTVAAIRAALETAGVEFIAENGGGAGVRLWKTDRPKCFDLV
jgi:hypothetical protein